jgi:hypothetical protein
MPVTCRDYRNSLIEAARRGGELLAPALHAHVETCRFCAQFFDDQCALTAAMDSITALTPAPGAASESFVLAEFDNTRAPAWGWAAAACLALAACLGATWTLRRPPDATIAQPFITVPYTVPLAPGERAAIWHTRIPVAELVAAGYQIESHDPAALVEADVLVSQDGRTRAIRITN